MQGPSLILVPQPFDSPVYTLFAFDIFCMDKSGSSTHHDGIDFSSLCVIHSVLLLVQKNSFTTLLNPCVFIYMTPNYDLLFCDGEHWERRDIQQEDIYIHRTFILGKEFATPIRSIISFYHESSKLWKVAEVSECDFGGHVCVAKQVASYH